MNAGLQSDAQARNLKGNLLSIMMLYLIIPIYDALQDSINKKKESFNSPSAFI